MIGRMDSVSSLSSGYYTLAGEGLTPTRCQLMFKGPSSIVKREVDEDGDNNTKDVYDMPEVDYTYADEMTTYSQGTYIDQVTSSNRSAYPDNRYSGNYWYVYSGAIANTIYYEQITGIKVSGNAYINSRITATNNTRMVMDFNIPSLSSQQALCGARNGLASSGFAIFTYNDNAGFQVDYASAQKNHIPSSGTYTGRHTLDLNKNVFYLDGTAVHTFTNTSFSGSYPIYIGSINNGGSAMTAYPADGLIIYPCQIYSNGTIVRNYVPAKSNSGTVGLFDKVNNVFYNNIGSGSFTAIE